MYFNGKDIEQFQVQKQFIDTVIVPILNVSFADATMRQSGSEAEFLMSLTAFIEQQFKGRLMLLPPFSYFEEAKETMDLQAIYQQLLDSGFKHVFFLTSDQRFANEKEFPVVWLPAIPLESMDKTVKQRILEDQLQQVVPIFTRAWTNA